MSPHQHVFTRLYLRGCIRHILRLILVSTLPPYESNSMAQNHRYNFENDTLSEEQSTAIYVTEILQRDYQKYSFFFNNNRYEICVKFFRTIDGYIVCQGQKILKKELQREKFYFSEKEGGRRRIRGKFNGDTFCTTYCVTPLFHSSRIRGRANIWAIIFTQRVSAGRHWVTEIIHKVIPALHDPGDTRVYVFKSFHIVKQTVFE